MTGTTTWCGRTYYTRHRESVPPAEEGRRSRSLRRDGQAHDLARMVVSSLEGAMLVARSYDDVQRFEAAAARLFADLDVPRREHGAR